MDKQELQHLLIGEEDEVLHAYQDSLGYWTIGVGHLIDARKGGGISAKISRLILNDDMDEKYSELVNKAPWIMALDSVRQNTLIAMAFQMGIDGLLGFKLAMAYMQGEHYEMAADEFLKSRWADQTPERAKRMTNRIRTGQLA